MSRNNLFRYFTAATLAGLIVFFFLTSGVEGTTRSSTESFTTTAVTDTFNLRDYGATGDGVTDDGPALQDALDAIAGAGGGTLLVPAGRYAIVTPVTKDFTGLAQSVTIQGVESSTPVPPPTAGGAELTRGLDLVSEFYPRTGAQIALNIKGLQNFLIKDIAFVGTPNVNTDAAITLSLDHVDDATVRHCEYYGLSTQAPGGAIVMANWSRLTIEQTVFLGCTANSGLYTSVVQSLYWKGITVSDAVFADYGQRPELFGKTGIAAPYSWISINNAVAPDHNSPRREAVISRVFLDEGALAGIASLPNGYLRPSAPIDLLYVTDLFMNVSNLGTSGNYLEDLRGVLIENSHYGWSHNASAAIYLVGINNAILDRLECVASANHIRADARTGRLTVINSIFDAVVSQAQVTNIIDAPESDPVAYVRQRFTEILGRAPDAAAHYYWSDRLLRCGEDAQCDSYTRAALANYIGASPSPTFALSGRITDEIGAGVPGVVMTLSRSQSVSMESDSNGYYHFSHLPTSGIYTLTVAATNQNLTPSSVTFTTPVNDQTANFAAQTTRHSIGGRVADAAGNGVADVSVSLTGAAQGTFTTGATGNFAFANLPAGGSYTVTATKTDYSFAPQSLSFSNLNANQTANFTAKLERYAIRGRVTNVNNDGIAGVTVNLSGSHSGTTTTDAGGNFEFANLLGGGNYTVSPILFLFDPTSRSYHDLRADQYAPFVLTGFAASTLEFASASVTGAEGAGAVQITVTRGGDIFGESTIRYSATDGTASQGSDVNTVIGQLNFAPGEVSKVITIFITDDTFVEGDEHLTVTLSNPEGAVLDSRSSAALTIADNDTSEAGINPIDDARFFVRQQYRDFLNREPDPAGLDFWSNQIVACGNNPACLTSTRQHVSAAFFLSIEFQETGYLVHRLYKTVYGRVPRRIEEFLLDTRLIGENVVVGTPGWGSTLEANKLNFLAQMVERPDFVLRYPLTLTPAELVGELNVNTGFALTPDEVTAAVAEFDGAPNISDATARQRALRRVAENRTFVQRETNAAFVQMQYFGYLQRHPDDAPDSSFDGFNFWLNKLNQFGGDYIGAEMVRAFIESTEYRTRFGG